MKKSREELQTEQNENVKKCKRKKKQGATIVELTKAALMTALFCVLAPVTIYLPVSPVGITLGTLLVYLTGTLLGAKLGCSSVLLYLALGFLGLPVFSGYTAGAGVLFGPTGGYLLGYLPCVVFVGLFSKGAGRGRRALLRFVLGIMGGTVVLYLFGTLWFLAVYAKEVSFADAVLQCVVPFLPLDAVKIIIAAVLFAPLRRVKEML
ncbi:MAG: biotin transporter BioY [Lachnospiraceae bacterium]|nr:biotin transporter BioY [Lachnospiraceae bacterium]